ncbi:MAG: hypothetical protein A2951_00545 [Candidatus Buchananbacteria bacterium RIFCSPLOWO2_01_FULL_56_15]|uniref:DUF2090 domain-containing protein n=2 Tax=Candidatus Buchananiibacteriota TaxID=1817903 RepID=A0A1G1YGH7_9BACT|nr:MAG: hypothetical protein A3J59_04475 [Candidatus Buchananbacteria bacterium RIFCSPHIGHO2_02_FULL_56_16]OGY54632.1 MAG: hypothetical protein A2951_00545 [Candidatus Buchananbacteria bacterium RIFCSPLOWO2_01_FULL_56_15]
MPLGYTNPLFILPFDHRSSFMKKMFGIEGRQPTAEETKLIASYKQLIYDGFKLAVEGGGVPKESAAILTDEQFGDAVLKDAAKTGYTFCLATEKSGSDEFDFEYGEAFASHIEQYHPTIVKALIRYNPEENQEMNARQRKRLEILSNFCHQSGYKFLIEPLVPASATQLERVGNDQHRYDNEIRPALMVKMIAELQADEVEPDIWKIEGFEQPAHYEKIVAQARSGIGRGDVAAVVLGRGADDAQVETWLRAGAGVDGIVGFAIGRTIFWQPLVDYKENKISAEQATRKISDNYLRFYSLFIKENTQKAKINPVAPNHLKYKVILPRPFGIAGRLFVSVFFTYFALVLLPFGIAFPGSGVDTLGHVFIAGLPFILVPILYGIKKLRQGDKVSAFVLLAPPCLYLSDVMVALYEILFTDRWG